MREWKKHSVILAVSLTIGQVVVGLAPGILLYQLVVLTTTSNLAALVYAVWAFKRFEDTTERLKPVFTSRLLRIIDKSYESMAPSRRDQLERNLEKLVAVGLVYIDRVGEMDEEQFGEAISRFAYPRIRVTPEEIRAKLEFVGGT